MDGALSVFGSLLARRLSLAFSNARRRSTPDVALDELSRQVDELRASRARVVVAADAERRRIERDLHDGAQQHLVALAVNLQLVRQLADSDPAAAKTLLEEIGRNVQEALENVRALAHGVYPPLLLDRGLAEALRGAASETGIPARVEAAELERYPPEVEATVYFACLEALQNTARHAGAKARATVRAWPEQGALLFEVRDDGAGFDQRAHHPGTGLTNMSDRVGAVGGRLTISSEPDGGTCISGMIPLAP
jgi:signal transduction histidine kinase